MRPDPEHLLPVHEQGPTAEQIGAPANVATLVPTQAPGRLTRKARHYLPQIVQLRAQGYTLEAIQQALAAAGIAVSISTVRREALRPVPIASWAVGDPVIARVAAPAAPASFAVAPAGANPHAASGVMSGFPDACDGKDVAAAFAQSKSTNALTRAKDKS